MKTMASSNTLTEEQDVGSGAVISGADLAKQNPGWGIGTPIVRNGRDIVWEPDSDICHFWSIEGGGTIAARDEEGKLIEAYRLKEGESVETMTKLGG